MNFNDVLPESTTKQVEQCDLFLSDPKRLEALEQTGLMDSPTEEAFDRLASLAARILKVPLTIISFVSDKKQFFKAAHGLPAPYDETRQVPIDGSICRYTLAGEAIIAADASVDALLMHHPATEPWGIAAFMAIPLITEEGHVLGAFCAVDSKPRPWSEDDVYLMRELTQSVMTEIRLRQQVRDLEFERDVREQFVATLSHDLRTPLSVARMGAEILSQPVSDAKEQARISDMIRGNMDHADRMIRDLLDATYIKAGQSVPLNIEKCNLNELIHNTVEALSSLHGTRLIARTEPQVSGYWDQVAIRRVLDNLIGNAVKYGSESGIVTVGLGLSDNKAIITVHNEGIPIPSENLKEIFAHYKRTESASSGKQRGWGMGLTLVKGFAEAHGGTASVESQDSKGTTFKVTLPLDCRN